MFLFDDVLMLIMYYNFYIDNDNVIRLNLKNDLTV